MGSSCSKITLDIGGRVTGRPKQQYFSLPRVNFKVGKDPIVAQEISVLLLGAGECGKSTIVKQMKIIHDNGYSEDEKIMFRMLAHSNAIQSLFIILQNMDLLSVTYKDKDVEDMASDFCQNAEDLIEMGVLTEEIAKKMQTIWLDEGVRECHDRGHEYGLPESAFYFLEALSRLSESNYIPTEQDILRSRAKTTGVVEIFFHYKGLDFRMVDVGGQRSERKKWIHFFDNAKAVIFIAALSDYDLVLVEDPSVNRMKESVRLFGTICNNRWFVASSMILFLNKTDVFQYKLEKKSTSIASCFPKYLGNPYDYEETTNFIQDEFTKQNKTEKEVYTHFTCATQTNNITFVFDAVTDILLRETLKLCGLY